ncbi:MAG TPA: hypothetical protein DDX91_01845 [Ruminococcaceae bacterium]|nr:hypothetical protein [Oscillospiraceae bacterium]
MLIYSGFIVFTKLKVFSFKILCTANIFNSNIHNCETYFTNHMYNLIKLTAHNTAISTKN